MKFEQIIEEQKWININPYCIYFFFPENEYQKRDKLEKYISQFSDFHCRCFCVEKVDVNPSDETYSYFFSRSIVARIFPVSSDDYHFLGEKAMFQDKFIINRFINKLRDLNRIARMNFYNRHSYRLNHDLPYPSEEKQLLRERGIWSIEESDAFVENILWGDDEMCSQDLRDFTGGFSRRWSYLIQERKEVYGRSNGLEGRYLLKFSRDKEGCHHTFVDFPNMQSKILYYFFLLNPTIRCTYEELQFHKYEILAITNVLYDQHDEEYRKSVAQRMLAYDPNDSRTSNFLSQANKGIREAFGKCVGADFGNYILKEKNEGTSRFRYIDIPQDHIMLDLDFVERVRFEEHRLRSRSPRERAINYVQAAEETRLSNFQEEGQLFPELLTPEDNCM